MLPPVDSSILQRYADFEILYTDLTIRKLNPDGSTRDTKKQRVHDEIRRSLNISRSTLLKSEILTASLSDLPSRTVTLPSELHAVIEIVAAQLNGLISSSDRDIVTNNVSHFLSSIEPITDALSTHISVLADHLCTIADPLDPPSVTNLAATAGSLQRNAGQTLPQEVASSNTHLTDTLSILLSTHLTLLTSLIQILSQTQHGASCRHTKSTADLLAARSTLIGLEAKIHALNHSPPPEYVAALKEYSRNQGKVAGRLKEREELARRELELYGKAGEKGMRDLAKRKSVLEKEMERCEGEVQRLEAGQD